MRKLKLEDLENAILVRNMYYDMFFEAYVLISEKSSEFNKDFIEKCQKEYKKIAEPDCCLQEYIEKQLKADNIAYKIVALKDLAKVFVEK